MVTVDTVLTVISGDEKRTLQNGQTTTVTKEQYAVKISFSPTIKWTTVAESFLRTLIVTTTIKDRAIETVDIPNQWKMFLKANLSPVDHPHPDDYGVIIGPPCKVMGVGPLECLAISHSLYRTYYKSLPNIYQAYSRKHSA
eukprot:7175892-Ditylum_brightwellii.AAC.1